MQNIIKLVMITILIAVCCFILCSCNTRVKSAIIQPGDINTVIKDKPTISIIEYKTNQEGSFATGAIIDLFVGPIGSIIRATTPTEGGLSLIDAKHAIGANDYVSDLNNKSLNLIQSVLISSKVINYIDVRKLKINASVVKNLKDDKSRYINIMSDNNLTALLLLELDYFVVKGSLKKQIALKTDWTLMYNNDFQPYKARTVVTYQTDEVFPNTYNEEFKDIMLEFARASADDFLLLLQGKEPLNGNESVFRY